MCFDIIGVRLLHLVQSLGGLEQKQELKLELVT